MDVDESDLRLIRSLVEDFYDHFGFDCDKVMNREFTKIVPVSRRPYGSL